MQELLEEQTIKSFISNFRLPDQLKVIKDLVVIGIETVMHSLKSNPDRINNYTDRKPNSNSFKEEVQNLKRDIKVLTNNINTNLGDNFRFKYRQQLIPKFNKKKQKSIQYQGADSPQLIHKLPSKKEVTQKVTEIFPFAQSVSAARSTERFKHHLDDTEIRKIFIEPDQDHQQVEKTKNSKSKRRQKQKQKQKEKQRNRIKKQTNGFKQIQTNYGQQQINKKKNKQLTQESPQKISSIKRRNKKQKDFEKNTIVNGLPYSLNNVKSIIKDVIDFDKKNANNSYFKKIIQQQRHKQTINDDNLVSFKRPHNLRKSSRRNSSSSISSQQFSPFKKNMDNQKDSEEVQKLKRDSRNKKHRLLQQSSDDKSSEKDSQFSIYKDQEKEVFLRSDCSSRQSFNSSKRAYKAVGKISQKR